MFLLLNWVQFTFWWIVAIFVALISICVWVIRKEKLIRKKIQAIRNQTVKECEEIKSNYYDNWVMEWREKNEDPKKEVEQSGQSEA